MTGGIVPEHFDRAGLFAKSSFETFDERQLWRLAIEQRARADRAEARIETAKAVAAGAGLINWEEDNYAAGAAHVAAALEATA